MSVLLGTGTGSFGAQTTFAAGCGSASAVVADFDGDGQPDLAVANDADDDVSVLINRCGR